MNTERIHLDLPFRDRMSAGRVLAAQLRAYANHPHAVVLALPRGGVPVGAEIAASLNLPLFVFAVRKLGVPGREELAMGAITSGGRTLVNHSVTRALHISAREIQLEVERELRELARRERLYSRGQRIPELKDKLVILADDGIATGSSMLLAAQAIRAEGAAYIVVAVPVAPKEAISQLHQAADQVLCLAEPEPFVAVGQWYEDFHQVSDQEVCTILDRLLEKPRELQSA
jgi:putative phosphoribosyl transferase